MEVIKMNNTACAANNNNNKKDDEEEDMLPGFRFHPTDEELVGFYLRRKVEKKPISIELIKQIDIYKYDPWDLPKVSTVGDKEWYFFCIRGRKYRNSVRPNRVTGSGFWKATGIDKTIHSVKEGHECIGLKKSLVYYRGSAGKGTKTDWMMHEFRLPPNGKITNLSTTNDIALQAEVWTLCRIFKRTPSYKKYTAPNWNSKDNDMIKLQNPISDDHSSSKTCSSLDSDHDHNSTQHIGFGDSVVLQQSQRRVPFMAQSPFTVPSFSGFRNPMINGDDFFTNGNWDELRSVVELAIDPSSHHVYHDHYCT